MEDFKVDIGNRLKYLRKKKGCKINEIVDFLKIGRSTYTDWELGRRSPNGEKLVLLAKFHNTTVDFITSKTDDDSAISTDDLEQILKHSKLKWNGEEIDEDKQAAAAAILKTYFSSLYDK
ncbi:helix-turn-helix domain-containing protein [Rossellomorea marisflavi]|uniref:helix-turn-helix domain-containing protein n=1 Tax=Rossellomorea marisflavi TaxID=189381 RepID=UPI003D2EB85E